MIGERTYSYRELDGTARHWGAALQGADGRVPERIGVLAYRSHGAYAGTLAALYSGAAFVPLNRTYPLDRTEDMIRRAQLDAIIVDGASAEIIAGFSEQTALPRLLAADGQAAAVLSNLQRVSDTATLSEVTPLRVLPPVAEDAMAYLLFTSGSTGVPKGVGVSHANVLHFLDAAGQILQITKDDRFSQTFDQTFDLAVFDLFMAWNHGACVCAARSLDLIAPATYVRTHSITVWFSVPSVITLMQRKRLLKAGSMPGLRLSLFCGEPLPHRSVEAWLTAAPASTLHNLYGPTELTIACLSHQWDPARSPAKCRNGVVPIGRPFNGLTATLLDDEANVATGAREGELAIAGPQTTHGYWQDLEKTKERFVDISVSGSTFRRFYRTGDRVARDSDGDYLYLGRTDHQIKVLGYRVELGEIESVLAEAEGVVSAVAVGWPQEDGRALGIVAFVLGEGVDPMAVRRLSAKRLPPYMVPSDVRVLDHWPLNANGKIDRTALIADLAEE